MSWNRAVRRSTVVDLLDVIDDGDAEELDIDLLVDLLGLAGRRP